LAEADEAGSVIVGFRRIFLVAASSAEGLLTERRTAAQPWRRELAFMPHSRPSRQRKSATASVKPDISP